MKNIVKKKATKKILAELAKLREEAFAKAKAYNKLAKQYTLGDDITQEMWDDYDFDDHEIEELILFDKCSRKQVEPEGFEEWLPSNFCG